MQIKYNRINKTVAVVTIPVPCDEVRYKVNKLQWLVKDSDACWEWKKTRHLLLQKDSLFELLAKECVVRLIWVNLYDFYTTNAEITKCLHNSECLSMELST